MFVVPGVLALIVEPLLFLLADRYPRRWFIRGGVAAMAAASLGAAMSRGPVTLTLAIGLLWIATGSASALAQATLVDARPDARASVLARWTLSSSIGDFVAPILFAALAALGLSWRSAFAIVGALLALWCALLCIVPIADGKNDDDEEAGLYASLRDALTDRVLVAWLFGTALCDLLDEILLVFASLRLRVELGAGPFWQTAVAAAFMVGSTVGLVVLERLLRLRNERYLLVAASVGTLVCYVPWLVAPTPLASVVLAVPVGLCAAPLYPLAAAQAYARRPNASGSVLAASHLFTPLGLALPWLIGALADAAGTTAALATLALQPLGLLVLVALTTGSSSFRPRHD